MADREVRNFEREGWEAFMSQQTRGCHRLCDYPPGNPEWGQWEAGWNKAKEVAGTPLCGLLIPPRLFKCQCCGAIYHEGQLRHCESMEMVLSELPGFEAAIAAAVEEGGGGMNEPND